MRRSAFSLFLLIVVMSTGGFSTAAVHARQSGGVTVVIESYDRANRASITDVCYVIVNASNEGCDENGDGAVTFEGVRTPVDHYTVRQTQGSPGYLPVGDFPIYLGTSYAVQTFPVYMNSAEGVTVEFADVAIASVDSLTGELIPGACYLLRGGSNEGCDENGDGYVDFEDVPVGSYYLEQRSSPGEYVSVAPRWVGVMEDGVIAIEFATVSRRDGSVYEREDIALVTRDPTSGQLLTGACYIIVNASNEGCDENGDGQVDFEDVSVGVFTVTQTVAPQGYEPVRDFEINIAGDEPTESFIVAQREFQADETHQNVSVILLNYDTGERILRSSACVVLVGVSTEGCDDNGDGQIDFLDIPLGRHTIQVTQFPYGHTTLYEDDFAEILVEPDAPYSIEKWHVWFVEMPQGI